MLDFSKLDDGQLLLMIARITLIDCLDVINEIPRRSPSTDDLIAAGIMSIAQRKEITAAIDLDLLAADDLEHVLSKVAACFQRHGAIGERRVSELELDQIRARAEAILHQERHGKFN